MSALSAALFLMKWKGALHAIDYVENRLICRKRRSPFPQLVELSAKEIAQDSTFAKNSLRFLPPQLLYHVMRAAIIHGYDSTTEVLLPYWPEETISLLNLWPDLYGTLEMLYDHNVHKKVIKQGIQTTTVCIKALIKLIKKNTPTKVRHLDLRGFPTADLTVSVLAEEIIEFSRTSEETRNPEDIYNVTIDCVVRDDETFIFLRKAIALCQENVSSLNVTINKLDVSCIGTATIKLLLEDMSHMPIVGLSLQYNSINNLGLETLFPRFINFQTLTSLDLCCNKIVLTNSGNLCKEFSKALSRMRNLRRLDFSNNRFTGCVGLVFGKVDQPLEYLKLSACILADSDLQFLGRAHFTSKLLELDLSENSILSQRVASFGNMITAMSSLQVLEIEDCKFESHHIPQLVSSIAQLKCLRYFNFAHHALVSEVLYYDWLQLGIIPKLECLRFSFPEDCYSEAESSASLTNRKEVFQEKFKSLFAAYRQKKVPDSLDVRFMISELRSFS